MSRIAIIGSGKIGSALAARFDAAGIAAVIANSRGPASLVNVTARFGENFKAVEAGEVLGADNRHPRGAFRFGACSCQ